MSEAEHVTEARRWLRYARADLAAASKFSSEEEEFARHVCWLAQQSAEKAIKAVLVFLQIDFPYRHDLEALRNLLPAGWKIKEADLDMPGLTEWAVEARYPGEWPEATRNEADNALELARRILEIVTADLDRHGLADQLNESGRRK
ncbi:MAG TPA: HEPN domain-containing protein [bacterium]|nr:HEPN domain-containing protein [bacterium]